MHSWHSLLRSICKVKNHKHRFSVISQNLLYIIFCESTVSHSIPDNCASKPCLYGGKCTNGVNDYTCACPLGFSGKTCEVRRECRTSSPCGVGNTCIDILAKSEMQCACTPLYKAGMYTFYHSLVSSTTYNWLGTN